MSESESDTDSVDVYENRNNYRWVIMAGLPLSGFCLFIGGVLKMIPFSNLVSNILLGIGGFLLVALGLLQLTQKLSSEEFESE